MKKYIVLAVLAGFFTYFLKDTVCAFGYASYKDTLGALLNISSIIFAIIGAWIAIIYPRAIGRAFNANTLSDESIKDADADAGYLSELVEIVMVSAIVLMFVLTIQFSVPVLKGILSPSWMGYARYAGFYIVTMLTLSQIHAIFRVILANYYFLNKLRKKNIDIKVDELHN